MKAEKTKSGKYRVRVYVGKDAEGKQHFKSVTAPTKQEALRAARKLDWRLTDNITVAEAVERYLSIKQNVISPSTYRSYEGIYKNHISGNMIGNVKLSALSPVKVQSWVSELATKVSAKTVKNCYGLFTAAVSTFAPEIHFYTKLPQRMKPQTRTPSSREVLMLAETAHALGKRDLFISILLGSVCMMRRGEICALLVSDIDFERNTIRINKSQVRTKNGYAIKPPKTDASNRIIVAPQVVMLNLPREGERIVSFNAEDLSKQFKRLCKRAGIEPCRFHDLRHYGASILATGVAGVSTEAIKQRGGWSGDSMMKRVYINQIGNEIDRETKIINTFFDDHVFGQYFWQT